MTEEHRGRAINLRIFNHHINTRPPYNPIADTGVFEASSWYLYKRFTLCGIKYNGAMGGFLVSPVIKVRAHGSGQCGGTK